MRNSKEAVGQKSYEVENFKPEKRLEDYEPRHLNGPRNIPKKQ